MQAAEVCLPPQAHSRADTPATHTGLGAAACPARLALGTITSIPGTCTTLITVAFMLYLLFGSLAS